MRTRLETVEAIRDALYQIESADPIPITFPSERRGLIRVGDSNFSSRTSQWLRRYRVWLDVTEPSPDGLGRRHEITLMPTAFGYGLEGFVQSPVRIQRQIRGAERSRDAAMRIIEASQAELVEVSAVIKTVRLPTPLTDIEAAVAEWPEALSVVAGPDNGEGYTVPSCTIGVGFIPVAYVQPGGDIALTSTLLPMASSARPNWYDGQFVTAHPHVDRQRYCFGTGGAAVRAMGRLNQVIATFDIIRHWRASLNTHDMYGHAWPRHAWALLASVRGGHLSPLLGWDGNSVQRSDTGDVVPLEGGLVDDIDLATHVGMWTGGNVTYMSHHDIVSVVGDQDTTPSSCPSCGRPTKRCRCHERFCVGCQEQPNYCICEGSSCLIGRYNLHGFMIKVPPSYESYHCGYCDRPQDIIALVSTFQIRAAPLPVGWQACCRGCVVINPTLAGLYKDWEENHDRTHEESSTDDANSSTRSADA
jgi:hypothetical protein